MRDLSMRVLCFAVCLPFVLTVHLSGQESRLELRPVSADVKLDGTLDSREWQHAQTVAMGNGVRLVMQQDGRHLFIGVDAQAGFSIGNIFIRRGDQLWNLHASAAIGTIQFATSGEGWALASQSGWSARGADLAKIESELEASLGEYGWAGTNAMLGAPGQREFALKLADFLAPEERELRLVFTHLHLDPERVWSWPQPDDSSVDPEVQKGYFPDRLDFQQSRWGVLVLADR